MFAVKIVKGKWRGFFVADETRVSPPYTKVKSYIRKINRDQSDRYRLHESEIWVLFDEIRDHELIREK